MQRGNYVIVSTGEGKGGAVKGAALVKVTGIHGKELSGVVEKNCHIPDMKIVLDFTAKDVVIDLGTDPRPGKVYGVDVGARYVGRKIHEAFGSINFFYTPKKEVGAQIMKAFDKAHKTLVHNKLDFIIQPDQCIWEIMPYVGERYAGMYKKAKKGFHRLLIRPEIMPSSEWPYVIYHELAHHMHLSMLDAPKLNAQWVQLYNTSIQVQDLKREVCYSLRDRLLAQEDRPSDFKGQLDEEDATAFKWIVRSIKYNHNLSIKELDVLFEADYRDELRDLWPARVSSKDLAPIISEYSTVSYKELLAEAFAFMLTGKKLPKGVQKLMDRTIAHARTNNG